MTILEYWRQNYDFGDIFWMLVLNANVKRYRMLVTKVAKSVTNILKLSPTYFVSNVRHQHRCSPSISVATSMFVTDVGDDKVLMTTLKCWLLSLKSHWRNIDAKVLGANVDDKNDNFVKHQKFS